LVIMRADKFLTEAEQERIHQAVIAAESRTSGEIVPMVVTSSARYTEIELFGVITGLFLGMLLGWLWHDPWESYHLNLWPVIGATMGFLIARIPAVKRRLASKTRIAEAVNDRCLAAFTEHGLHYTRDHTGILILVSLLEHRVEVLADRGINEKVPPETWNEIVNTITTGLKSRRACEAFCKAVQRCGDILATHFPRQADDRNELPNKLVGD
jgi:putative membrane protein